MHYMLKKKLKKRHNFYSKERKDFDEVPMGVTWGALFLNCCCGCWVLVAFCKWSRLSLFTLALTPFLTHFEEEGHWRNLETCGSLWPEVVFWGITGLDKERFARHWAIFSSENSSLYQDIQLFLCSWIWKDRVSACIYRVCEEYSRRFWKRSG